MPKRNSAVIDGVDEFDFDAPEVGPPSTKHYQKLILMHQKLILMHQKMVAVIGAAEEDAIKAPEKIKPSGEEKETEGAAEEDAIKAPPPPPPPPPIAAPLVGGAEATITASDDEWELQGSCHNYAGACVGGGEAPEIETIWGKHGTRIWCQYRGEWYHQVLGEGLPNQWVVYIPRRIEGDA